MSEILSNVALEFNSEQYQKIVPFSVIKETPKKEKEIKYNKDGSLRNTKCNKVAGESSEVYAFRTKEEINAMLSVLNKHINESENNCQRQIAYRNKLLFVIGMNIGIRGSDLRTLKWSFFFEKDNDGCLKFKPFYVLQPMKQRKQKKFVKLFFNQAVKTAITDYTEKYPVEDLDEYLFESRKGNEPIAVGSLWRIIKDTASAAGIEQNIGSHSLRKSFGYWCWHNSEDKNKSLVILQQIFNHSSTQTTAKYIGILDGEIEDMFNSIELGINIEG